MRAKQKTATSKYFGVHKVREKWMAKIRRDGKQEYIGLFEDEIEAAIAYNRCALYLYKGEAELNAIPDIHSDRDQRNVLNV